MAIGNLFDNRNTNPPAWRQWSGDINFRKEDIDYLVKTFNETGEVKMTMNGESKQGKKGMYINIKLKEFWTGDKPEKKAPPKEEAVKENNNDTFSIDDLDF